jgi:hypothetical protein
MSLTPKNGTACFTFALVMVSTGMLHLRGITAHYERDPPPRQKRDHDLSG